MTLRNFFLQSASFSFQNNIFYQKDFAGFPVFENTYLSLREKENRLYTDEIVKGLPEIPTHHALSNEWVLREHSLKNLMAYLRKNNGIRILELGCGNGWLSNCMAAIPGSEVAGLDINEKELIQGSKVFKQTNNLLFIYADIFSENFYYSHFDYIILSGSLQYFRDIGILITKLLTLLADHGEIHILDSPVYNEAEVASAVIRSEKYFASAGFPLIKQHYYHQSWEMLKPFHPKILYDPAMFLNKIKQKISVASPFPWVKIKKRENS